jgi:hypothetical protein
MMCWRWFRAILTGWLNLRRYMGAKKKYLPVVIQDESGTRTPEELYTIQIHRSKWPVLPIVSRVRITEKQNYTMESDCRWCEIYTSEGL